MEFIESFMKFSFADDDVFRIENDELVREHTGRKACECVVLISPNIAFIEAKASSPNQLKSEKKFNEFIIDIKRKFSDSLSLFAQMRDGVFGEEGRMRIPFNLQVADVPSNDYLIYLIIHGHRIEWLPGLQDALRDALREVINEWNMKDSNVKAINEEIAKELHLITGYVPKNLTAALKQENGNADEEATRQWFIDHGM